MATLSDSIAKFLLDLLEKNQQGILEIQRNELANFFKCQPSQINYVLSTRFSMERGFLIESQRGGSGYIRIRKILVDDKNAHLKKLISEQIGYRVSQQEAFHILQFLEERKVITEREAKLTKAALSDQAILLPSPLKHEIRSSILKGILERLLIL